MKISLFHPSDDFFTDRLCRRYGVCMFAAVAIVVMWTTSRDSAIQCWTPAYFTGNHEQYTNYECWNTGKFYRLFSDRSQPMITDEELEHIGIFDLNKIKHLPTVLLLQGLIFLLPRLFWKAMGHVEGFPTQNIVNAADDVMKGKNTAYYNSLATIMTSYIRNPFSTFTARNGIPFGGHVMCIQYMITKLGYLASCVIQLATLTAYLGINFFSYRYDTSIWERISHNVSFKMDNSTMWRELEPFPRAVLCSFQIRQMGNVHPHTVMCQINANAVVERGLFIIWIWLWFSFFMLGVSTCIWAIRMIFYSTVSQSYKVARMQKLLGQPLGNLNPHPDKTFVEFSSFLLKPDGILMLEILEENVSIHAACGVAKAAWQQYTANQHEAYHDDVMQRQNSQTMYPELVSHAESIPLVEKDA